MSYRTKFSRFFEFEYLVMVLSVFLLNLSLALCAASPLLAQAQTLPSESTTPSVQWASRIVRFGSQLKSSGAYSAQQILGKPNILSHAGETNPCSWASGKDADRFAASITDFIRVGFEKPVAARQVAIAENFNPGAVTAVILYGAKAGETDTVYHAAAKSTKESWRMLNIFFEPPAFKVHEVELVLNVGFVAGQNEIDAIALGATQDTIKPSINTVTGVTAEVAAENLGENVNSPFDEVLPVISPDGKTLYFCRKNHPDNTGTQKLDDIWYAEREDSADGKPLQKPRWGKAKNIGQPLNNNAPNSVCAILPDGNTMLVLNSYLPSGRMAPGVSMTYRTTTGWSWPQKQTIRDYQTLRPLVNYSLASDGKTLLMAHERLNSIGGIDLFVSFLQNDGTWSVPKNLGTDINTAGEETTVFLASDGKTLYFSSDGHNGYGDNDVFIARRLDSTWTHWTEPQNLGSSVNTPDWDGFFSLPASGEYAYFVSAKNSFGEGDIFRIPVPEALRPRPVVLITGRTIDPRTKKPVGSIIRYELLSNGKELGIARSDSLTGRYSITLPAGENYGFRAEADGYLSVSENIDLRNLTQYREITRDLRIIRAAKGEAVLMNNIFFETAKWELKPESEPELMRIVEMLKKSPTMQIQIAGHTDNVGNKKNNLMLSERRAQAMADFVMQRGGIPAKRLQVKGFGSDKPVAPNSNEDGRQQNRRVEFVIISE